MPSPSLPGRSQWSRGLRRRSAAARLPRLWVRIPPGAWMSVCCECRVLSGRGLCDELITRSEESYRLWCVVVCDLETSWMKRPWPTGGCCAKEKKLVYRTCGGAVDWSTAPKAGRSQVRFIGIFHSLMLRAALWPWGRPSLQQQWVPDISPGGRPDNLTTFMCRLFRNSGSLNLLEA